MKLSLAISTLLLVGCWSAPLRAADPAGQAPARPAQAGFPAPAKPFTVPGAGEELTLEGLIERFGAATGVHFVYTKEISQMLQVSRANRGRPIEVAPAAAWEVFETLLIENAMWLAPLVEDQPRIFGVYSLNTQQAGAPRLRARHVPAAELDAWSRHPAILVTTVLDLPNTDVRTLSNSMRTLFTDANTQQIIPVGNSNSLLVTGFGPNIAAIARMLRVVDEASKSSAGTPRPAPAPAPEPGPAARDPR